MIYHVGNAFIGLGSVKEISEELELDHYGAYVISIGFAGVDGPYKVRFNKYTPGEAQSGRQAFAQIKAAVATRPEPSPKSSWLFEHGDLSIDLADVRAVEFVNRHCDARQHGNKRWSKVWFTYGIVVAGRGRIERRNDTCADIPMTPLHHEREKLAKQWLVVLTGENHAFGLA